jgi:hypothetical protein
MTPHKLIYALFGPLDLLSPSMLRIRVLKPVRELKQDIPARKVSNTGDTTLYEACP